jgi:hypothetical protein
MANFNGGTVVLGKGSWWIAYSIQGGGTATLVEGTLAQVKSWSQSKYGKSVQFPGTSVNINPFSGAGFGGSSTAIIIGPFTTKAEAESDAATGNYPANVSGSGNESSVTGAIPGLAQIGDFFARLTEGNTWIRIGEALLGIVLIAVGMARITHAVPVATSIARTVGATGLAVA